MKSPSFLGSGALLIGSLGLGCNAILGTTPGTLEGAGGAGGASSSASSSAGGAGGHGGAASSASSSIAASSSSDASSTSSGSDSCTTDADGDTYISIACPGGTDCDDGDALANPKGDYHMFPIPNPPPGTLPFDFNCSGAEEAETPAVTCGVDCTSQGFQMAVACGATAPLGKCGGMPGLCTFQLLTPAVSKTQRCK